VAAAAAGEAMVTAGRGLCQANRGRDAAGNVMVCGKANGHGGRCRGQKGVRDVTLALQGPCQANRGRDAAGNVVPCGRANGHHSSCRGQKRRWPTQRVTDAERLKNSAGPCQKNRGGVPCKRPANHGGFCTGQKRKVIQKEER
jgi:hypothetical protein